SSQTTRRGGGVARNPVCAIHTAQYRPVNAASSSFSPNHATRWNTSPVMLGTTAIKVGVQVYMPCAVTLRSDDIRRAVTSGMPERHDLILRKRPLKPF